MACSLFYNNICWCIIEKKRQIGIARTEGEGYFLSKGQEDGD